MMATHQDTVRFNQPKEGTVQTSTASDIRIRVAGIFIDSHRRVLVQRKRGDEYWALPGGRLEYGETLTECLEREFEEELGITIAVQDQVLVGENFFTHGDDTIHSIEFYYTITADFKPDTPIDPREPDLEFTWLGTEQLPSFRPDFIIDLLHRLMES